MERLTASEIRKALAEPFAAQDLEWRLQKTFEDQMRGIAVPYVTNRAIQNRLDDVVGVDNWYNTFSPWHSAGKKEAQICGISIYFEGRGFITKWDGAEDTDIEPVKGGLSDSMKRAAVQWGIGRVLYNMDSVWVSLEKRGKSLVIKESERSRLDGEYMRMLNRLHLRPEEAGGARARVGPSPSGVTSGGSRREGENRHTLSRLLIRPAPPGGAQSQLLPSESDAPDGDAPTQSGVFSGEPELTVLQAREQTGASGVSTSLMLMLPDGKKLLAYVRGAHPELTSGVGLYNVKKSMKKKDSVVYYELDSFEIGEKAA